MAAEEKKLILPANQQTSLTEVRSRLLVHGQNTWAPLVLVQCWSGAGPVLVWCRSGASLVLVRCSSGLVLVRNCTVLYSTVQYCTVQYNTVEYCTVLYSTVQ